MKLKERNSNYFNTTDTYVFLDYPLNKYIVTKVHLYNGSWYTDQSLSFKCTSLPCIKGSYLIGAEVIKENYKGSIVKFLPSHNCLGIQWRNKPLYFWNNINTLKIEL